MKKNLLAVVLALPLFSAQADYLQAMQAYEKKDYATALKAFQQIAELGDADAQRNLAAMYYNGQGTEVDLLAAYGWFTLLNDQLLDKAATSATLEKIRSQFSESQKQGVDALVAQLREQSGKLPLNVRLYPVWADTGNQSAPPSRQAMLVNGELPAYPKAALLAEVQGEIRLSFVVNAQGKASALHVEGKPGAKLKPLLRAAQLAVAASTFAVPAGATPKLTRWYYDSCFRLTGAQGNLPAGDSSICPLSGDGSDGLQLNKTALESRLNNAAATRAGLQQRSDEGDAGATRQLAVQSQLQQVLLEKDMSRSISQLWLQAALGGDVEAQYEMSRRLARGSGCKMDDNKSLEWLRLAAQQGFADARYDLARRVLAQADVAEDAAIALKFLRELAEDNHSGALYTLAQMEAGSNDDAALKSALAHLQQLPADDVAALNIKALVHAKLHQFDKAVLAQEKALQLAQAFEIDVHAMASALAAYQGSNLP